MGRTQHRCAHRCHALQWYTGQTAWLVSCVRRRPYHHDHNHNDNQNHNEIEITVTVAIATRITIIVTIAIIMTITVTMSRHATHERLQRNSAFCTACKHSAEVLPMLVLTSMTGGSKTWAAGPQLCFGVGIACAAWHHVCEHKRVPVDL